MALTQKRRGGRSLDTLQGVRKSMASVLRKMRAERMPIGLGNSLINGYTQLAHLMQDARDTLYQKRLKVLWQAHQTGQGAAAEPDEADDSGVQ